MSSGTMKIATIGISLMQYINININLLLCYFQLSFIS